MTNITAPTYDLYNTTSILNESGVNLYVKMVQFVSNPNPSVVQPFDYLVGILIVLTIFTIIFLSMKARGSSTLGAFFSASLVNFIICLLFYPIGIISGLILIIAIVLFIFAMFLIFVL
jgi:hypothetical protein